MAALLTSSVLQTHPLRGLSAHVDLSAQLRATGSEFACVCVCLFIEATYPAAGYLAHVRPVREERVQLIAFKVVTTVI